MSSENTMPASNPGERRALRFIIQASVFNGLMNGVFTIAPEMARQTLGAGKLEIGLLALLWPAGFMFAMYWTRLLQNLDNKSRLLLGISLLGRLPLMFCALFDTIWPMLGILAITVISQPAVVISQHALIQRYFSHARRSRVMSWSLAASTLTNMLGVLTFGILLDLNEQFYRLLLLVAGMAGMLEAFSLSRIQSLEPPTAMTMPRELHQGVSRFVLTPIWEFWAHMKRHPDFFRFERNFFIYGMGFMMLQPFVPIFLVNELKLSYTEIGLAKGTILQAAMILLYPFSGKLMERRNPIAFSALVFLGIAVFPTALILISLFKPEPVTWFVYGAYMLFAFPWTGVVLMWNMSSIYFARKQSVEPFSSAHVAMVGIRGMGALALSVVLTSILEPRQAFIMVLIFWLTASFGMLRHYRDSRSEWERFQEDEAPALPLDESKVPVLPSQRQGRIN